MPSVNVVNGKQIVVEDLDAGQRVVRFFAKPFVQVWHNQEIVAAILRREMRDRFKGSAAGWMWAVVAPLLAITVYTFAFTTTLQLPMAEGAAGGRRLAYALFIFSGIVVFNFFSEMAFRAPMLLHEYAHFIKQTIFPSDMLAVISTLRAGVYASISIGVMLVCQFAVTGTLHWTVLLIPMVILPFMVFLMGLSWFLSAIGAFTRDAGYLMITVVPLFMFATPVFYPQSALPPPLDFWIYANALAAYVECMRDLVLLGQIPSWTVYGWVLLTSVVTFYFGYWFFDRYRNVIVDVI
ncbi:MAG: ABC transporter permease [Enhydrobacter sp.]|nr:MAG: ABC transporter permease [Enhydrobacter sp.]